MITVITSPITHVPPINPPIMAPKGNTDDAGPADGDTSVVEVEVEMLTKSRKSRPLGVRFSMISVCCPGAERIPESKNVCLY